MSNQQQRSSSHQIIRRDAGSSMLLAPLPLVTTCKFFYDCFIVNFFSFSLSQFPTNTTIHSIRSVEKRELVLDLYGGGSANGTGVYTWPQHAKPEDWQIWNLKKV